MNAFGVAVGLEQIVLIKGGTSKHDALELLIDRVAQCDTITDRDAFRRAIFERESIMSTGIGGGIAIPHVRIPEVTTATLGVAVSAKGIDFSSLDSKPVHIAVLFATPEGADKEYLGLLARVMAALRNKELFDALVACTTPGEVYALLNGQA